VKVSARWSEAGSCFSIIAASASRIQAPEIICHAYTLQSSSTTVARGELESARQVFAILIEGIWFAQDSPLEGGGFEPPVPRQRRHPSATANHLSEQCRPVFKIELKPRRSAMTLSLPANRCTGHVILGLDRLTRHAAQMDREPELKIIWRRLYTAILAELVGATGRVTAIEFDGELAVRATANFAQTPHVRVVHGDGHANRVRTRRRHLCQCRRDAARASRPGDDLRSWGWP